MTGLVDYGMGNLRSVEKALERVGAKVRRVTQADQLDGLSKLVVPGQGAFRDCMEHLRQSGLDQAIRLWVEQDRPFLGICLGQQALFEKSFEGGEHLGLGLMLGEVTRLHGEGLKIPQIGWNRVIHKRPDCPLWREIPDGGHFYFDHSYAVRPLDPAVVAGEALYGEPLAAAVWQGRCFAVQFHPEKSQALGLKLLENFLQWTS